MRRELTRGLIAGIITLGLLAGGLTAQAEGESPASAAALGKAVAGMIECGDTYDSHELYNIRITLHEVLRGAEALARLGADVVAPAAGMEYLLVRASFAYKARGRPGDCVHEVRATHFRAMSPAGGGYPAPVMKPPLPLLDGPVRSGETLEGWLVLQAAGTDAMPLLSFSVDDTGGVSHGGNLWFKLGAE